MNINKKEQELVDEVMENFDFVRCHQTMRMLDWRWAIPNNQVPTIERLKTSAMNRIEGAIESAKESKKKKNDLIKKKQNRMIILYPQRFNPFSKE